MEQNETPTKPTIQQAEEGPKKLRKHISPWIVVAIVVVLASTVVFFLLENRFRQLEGQNWAISMDAGRANWANMNTLMSSQTQASDDGEWYIVPEVRVRFPYFVPMSIDSSNYQPGRPLRHLYTVGTFDDDNQPVGVSISFSFNQFTPGRIDADDIPAQECASPFMIQQAGGDWWDGRASEGYELVNTLTLADGRAIEIGTNKDSRCVAVLNSELGDKLLESLSKLESL